MLSRSFFENCEKTTYTIRQPSKRSTCIMAVSYCFFDLDGTLVDSSAGIINSINYALDKMALPPFRAEEVPSFLAANFLL